MLIKQSIYNVIHIFSHKEIILNRLLSFILTVLLLITKIFEFRRERKFEYDLKY